jgi:hypothetical protein
MRLKDMHCSLDPGRELCYRLSIIIGGTAMTMARAHLVDPSVSRWYHCLTRCFRRAFLLGEGANDRKAWIESRLRELAEIFAVSVGGFSVLDNLLRI